MFPHKQVVLGPLLGWQRWFLRGRFLEVITLLCTQRESKALSLWFENLYALVFPKFVNGTTAYLSSSLSLASKVQLLKYILHLGTSWYFLHYTLGLSLSYFVPRANSANAWEKWAKTILRKTGKAYLPKACTGNGTHHQYLGFDGDTGQAEDWESGKMGWFQVCPDWRLWAREAVGGLSRSRVSMWWLKWTYLVFSGPF